MKRTWPDKPRGIYRESRKKNVMLYIVTRALIILCMFRQLANGYYHHVLLCMLSLVLISVPVILRTTLKINLPNIFEVAVCLFVYAAEILGEIGNFYGNTAGTNINSRRISSLQKLQSQITNEFLILIVHKQFADKTKILFRYDQNIKRNQTHRRNKYDCLYGNISCCDHRFHRKMDLPNVGTYEMETP